MGRIGNTLIYRLLFLFYFVIISAFPYSHSHLESESVLSHSDAHLHFSEHGEPGLHHGRFTHDHSTNADLHLHFLAEDSNSVSGRTGNRDKSNLKNSSAIPQKVIIHPAEQPLITTIQDRPRSYSGGLLSPYSGLSPPRS